MRQQCDGLVIRPAECEHRAVLAAMPAALEPDATDRDARFDRDRLDRGLRLAVRLSRRHDRNPVRLGDDARRRDDRIVAGFGRHPVGLEKVGRFFESASQRTFVEGLRRAAHRLAPLVLLGGARVPAFPKCVMDDADAGEHVVGMKVGAVERLDAHVVVSAQREAPSDRNHAAPLVDQVRV